MAFRYAELEDRIVSVIRRECEGRDVAVASSGGLDSGLVAMLANEYADSVTMYTCGTSNAFDVAMARDMADRTGIPWVRAPISKGSVESDIIGLMRATGTSDPFTVSYELQLYCVCKTASEQVVLTGQGADEYFMGCAKYVGCSRGDFDVLVKAGKDRLRDVSMVCEASIAEHFGKTLVYPYMDPYVTGCIEAMDPEELIPEDMDSRKRVLKDIARHLGYGFLADRRKKSSQYGSGTTDLIRGLARDRKMMYNQYISVLYEQAMSGVPANGRGAAIYARVDSLVKAQAEAILKRRGMTPSEAIEGFYRRIIEEDRD